MQDKSNARLLRSAQRLLVSPAQTARKAGEELTGLSQLPPCVKTEEGRVLLEGLPQKADAH